MDPVTRAARTARQGDNEALGEFVRSTQAEVRRLCGHLVDEQSADDLTQEAYLRAIRALPAFRGESSARTWLLGIARRACMDELRTRTRRRRRDALLAQPIDGIEPDGAEQAGVVAVLAELEPDRRAAFVLTQLLGCSYAETAVICGCPIGTIRSRVARARCDLIGLVTAADDEVAGNSTRRQRD